MIARIMSHDEIAKLDSYSFEFQDQQDTLKEFLQIQPHELYLWIVDINIDVLKL